MGIVSNAVLLLTHPNDFRTLLQYKLWHSSDKDLTSPKQFKETGWDRESMRNCWRLLDETSRSFSIVIKELEGELARVICIFYLVLRGLDTVEDDMTIPDDKKQPLLRTFHEKIMTKGFTFTDSGPDEKDRQLLVEFDCVVSEMYELQPHYREVIVDICKEMGIGMADYCHKAILDGEIGLDTSEDYDLYCHYVAGLVGEGLCRLLSASGKEAPWLGDQKTLANAMGSFLQKTNIIRDFREDVDGGRLFWPKSMYRAHGFDDPKEMCIPENSTRAVYVLNEIILDVLRHATDCLDYLTLIHNQSAFNFCAIPQSMAIATLALCFGNKDVFQRNVKIRKAEAARLIMRSTNPREVASMFREYSRQIHEKVRPTDPNYLSICIACSRIHQWYETHYPSFIHISAGLDGKPTQYADPADVRSKVMQAEEKRAAALALEKRANGNGVNGHADDAAPDNDEARTIMLWAFGIILGIGGMSVGIVYALLRLYPD